MRGVYVLIFLVCDVFIFSFCSFCIFKSFYFWFEINMRTSFFEFFFRYIAIRRGTCLSGRIPSITMMIIIRLVACWLQQQKNCIKILKFLSEKKVFWFSRLPDKKKSQNVEFSFLVCLLNSRISHSGNR